MGRRLPAVGLLAIVLTSGCIGERLYVPPCAPGDEACAAECTEAEALEVYRQRIEPLLQDDRPSSCNACHLTGIPLDAFVRDTPCQTMACLMDRELVDFAEVERSRILQWIERGQPHPEMVEAARAEYEGFRAWITYSAQCHAVVCDPFEQPCGPPLDGGPVVADAATDAGVGRPDVAPADAAAPPPDGGAGDAAAGPDAQSDAPDADLDAAVDAAPDAAGDAEIIDDGPCGPETLTTLFRDRVLSWRRRCNHCHAADGITAGVGGAPLWLVDEDTRPAARATMQAIVEAGYIDLEAPDQSLVILKPLHRGHGGIRHGGGNKFLSRSDQAYIDFLTWVDRHARCETGAALDGGLPGADIGPLPDAAVDAGPDAEPDGEAP